MLPLLPSGIVQNRIPCEFLQGGNFDGCGVRTCPQRAYLWLFGMGYWKGGGSECVLKIAYFEFSRMEVLMGGGSDRILKKPIFEFIAWGLRWVKGQN